MKLRDSFISIQHIANELNIPLSTGHNAVKNVDIFPSDYETPKSNPTTVDPQRDATVTENNIKIIDKHIKTAGARARNLKKSMLNDNKLIRLRNKLLRRSKSTAAITTNSSIDSTKCQEYAKQQYDCGNSKEEYQNKENEQPKLRVNSEFMDKTPPPKIMSPNRNRVKMGTRVFSSQFLNKSLDNIYDNAMSIYHSDVDLHNSASMQNESVAHQNRNNTDKRVDRECTDGCTTDSSSTRKCLNDDRYLSSTTDVDRMSLKSSSLSSMQCSDKVCETANESQATAEAYVIQSNTNGTSDAHYYSFQNETISDTLLDKFSNMTTTQNSQNDRIITRITIFKDSQTQQFKGAQLNSRALTSHEQKMPEIVYQNHNVQSIMGIKQDSGLALGISVVQGSDNNVYVKDLMQNGPGERHGILIGDQILAVNGTSLLNMPYEESLKLLQNTGNIVELTVSQIFVKYQQKLQNQQQYQQQNQHQLHTRSLPNRGAHSTGNSTKSTENYMESESQKMMAQFSRHSFSVHGNERHNKDKFNELPRLVHDDYDNDNRGANVILQNEHMNQIQCDDQNAVNFYSQFNEANSFSKRGFKDIPDLSSEILNSSPRGLSDSCSLQDKVVGLISKKPKRIPKTTKKYRGHMKFPVTPTRADIIGKNRLHCLSLLSDDDEQHVYI